MSDVGRTNVIVAGIQGPTGPTGPAGPAGGSAITVTAGEDLTQARAVAIQGGEGFRADSSTLAHAGTVVGIAATFIGSGGSGGIQVSGEFTFVGWSWGDGPIYLGLDGVLTQTAPTTGFLIQMGRPLSPTSMVIEVQQSIILG